MNINVNDIRSMNSVQTAEYNFNKNVTPFFSHQDLSTL